MDINNIITKMSQHLTTDQLRILELVLIEEGHNGTNEVVEYDDGNEWILRGFVSQKKLEGCANATIKQYYWCVKKMLEEMNKSAIDVDKDDIKIYLAYYQQRRHVSNITLNNMIRYLSSFFGYLENEEMIVRNPMRKIKSVKVPDKVKPILSPSELSVIKMSAIRKRDLAIMETLYSTGCRVSELSSLDIRDIANGEAVITGKGGKERPVYFSDECMYYLKEYLGSREDNNPALFVSVKKPYSRVSRGAIENIIRNIGRKSGIAVHPHKFRRTMATDSIRRGMRLEEVKEMLGHSKMDTTMLYCQIDRENVKNSHRRYIG